MSQSSISGKIPPDSNNINKSLYYRNRQLRLDALVNSGHEIEQAILTANIEYPILKAGDEIRFKF